MNHIEFHVVNPANSSCCSPALEASSSEVLLMAVSREELHSPPRCHIAIFQADFALV